jgi:hypothetical protein
MEVIEGRYVSRLVAQWQSLALTRKAEYLQSPERVCAAVEPLTIPEAVKLLVAVATDQFTAVQRRNDRTDVNDALASLRAAVAMLDAVEDSLDG